LVTNTFELTLTYCSSSFSRLQKPFLLLIIELIGIDALFPFVSRLSSFLIKRIHLPLSCTLNTQGVLLSTWRRAHQAVDTYGSFWDSSFSNITDMNTSGSLLSNRQRDELYLPFWFADIFQSRHRAILSYLSNASLHSSYSALREELATLAASHDDRKSVNGDDEQRYKGLLEKKWTSVIRLQKKVSVNLPAYSFFLQYLIFWIDHGP